MFPLNECLFSPLLFNIILDISLTSALRQEKKEKAFRLERTKTVFICKQHDPEYRKPYIISKNKKPTRISKFSKVPNKMQGPYAKIIILLYINNE